MNYIHHIESYDHTNWCLAELECEATVEGFGTACLSSLVSSPNVKSASEKCRLQAYCPDSFPAWCALQGMPFSPSITEPCVKMEPENIKMKLLFLWLESYVTILLPAERHLSHKLFTVCCVGYNILIKYWFILNPTLDTGLNTGDEQIHLQIMTEPKNTQCGNYCIMCATYNVHQDTITWYIFSSQDNHLWITKNNSFLAWTSIITKSYLPLRIPWKAEEYKVTMCVTVVTPSGIAHRLPILDDLCPLHSVLNRMMQIHAIWLTK